MYYENGTMHLNSYQSSQKNWLLKVHVCVVFMTMSICLQSYFYNDDSFNFNYAQAKAAVGNFKESEEVCNIRSEK